MVAQGAKIEIAAMEKETEILKIVNAIINKE